MTFYFVLFVKSVFQSPHFFRDYGEWFYKDHRILVQSVRSLGLSINPWLNLHTLLLSFFLELCLKAQISYNSSHTVISKIYFFLQSICSPEAYQNTQQHKASYLKFSQTLSHHNMLCSIIITRPEVFSWPWIPLFSSGGRFLLAAFHNLMITATSSIHWIQSQLPGISNFCLSFQSPPTFFQKVFW